MADNKGRPDIGDSILTLYPQALQNIMTQKQDMVVVGAKVKPKCTWLASQGCIKARALIEQVRRIDLEEFHDLYQQHRQLDPPNSKNLYALTITNVRQTNVDFNYYQLTAPSLFTRYRTAPSDLCPISRSYRKRKEAEEYAQQQPTLAIQDIHNQEAVSPIEDEHDETHSHASESQSQKTHIRGSNISSRQPRPHHNHPALPLYQQSIPKETTNNTP